MLLTSLQLLGVMLLWGGTFVCGRYLAQSYHPFVIAFYRFLAASIVLLPVLIIKTKGFPKLSKIQIVKVFFLGLTGIFSYNYFFFGGLALVEAGRASVIIATNPTITAILAPLFLKEEMSARKFLGVLIALSGALVVITGGNLSLIWSEGLGKGELFLVGAVLSWVSYTLLGKIALKKLSPLEATTLACVTGTIMLFPFTLKHQPLEIFIKGTPLDAFNIFFLGVLATGLGFIWYYDGIRKIGAAKAAAFINFVPLFGLSMGAIFLGEKPQLSLLWGALLVITGVSLANLKTLPFKLFQK
jgi:drug/metabolite transporter (DMT)-like permease